MTQPSPKNATDALAGFDALPDDALVPAQVVRSLFRFSPATMYRRLKAGTLPPPRRFGGVAVRWRVADLREVIAKAGAV